MDLQPLFNACPSPDSDAGSQESPTTSVGHNNNQIGTVILYGVPIVSLMMDNKERLCLAQISSTLLKDYSYNEIHNRRVALGITCAQCTPVQLELLRRAGAMPVTSRRCGMITRREAERLCKSFLGDHSPPKLPENFAFDVSHCCAWGCRGAFLPSRYNSSRAKCIKCFYCNLFFSPNKFIFHSHRSTPDAKYVQPDAANFNSWRRHIHLTGNPPDQVVFAWEDVKAMFNGGSRKRVTSTNNAESSNEACTSSEKPEESSKSTKSSKSPSKRIKLDTPVKVRVESAVSSSASPSTEAVAPAPVPPFAHPLPSQTLLSRLNSLVPNPLMLVKQSEPQLPDYPLWGGAPNRWWPYPLPLNPYYSYLMNKPEPFNLTNPQLNVSGWPQQLASLKARMLPPAEDRKPQSPEDDSEFVDVETTENPVHD